MLKLGLVAILAVTLLAFLGGCAPATPQTPQGEAGFDWTLVVFLVLIVAVFYFLMVRPQRRRQKQHQQLMEALKKGDQVVTAGGIYGQIESLSDDSVVLKVESGATIRIARSSVLGIRPR